MSRVARIVASIVITVVILPAGVYLIRNPEHETLDATLPPGVAGEFVHTAHGLTHYELAGPATAPTVVLVHGFSVPYYIWDSTATALVAAGFRVLRYDLAGRGWSDRTAREFTADLFDGQLLDLLDSLHITAPVHLAGLSFGGPISTYFADHHAARVRTLTLVDPAVRLGPLPASYRVPYVGAYLWQVLVVPGMAASQADDFVDPSRFPDWADRYRVQMRLRGFGRALRNTRLHWGEGDLDALYRRVGSGVLPVEILWGTADRTVPFALSDGLRQKMPAAEFHAIDHAGHVPTLEQAHLSDSIIVDFLRRNSK